MLGLVLALALATSTSAPAAAPIRRAVEAAVAVPGARAEVLEISGAPRACAPGEVDLPRPIAASGQAVVHLVGTDGAGRACEGWAWAKVRVTAMTLATTRAVADGEPLEGAVMAAERELTAGHPALTALPDGARAARAIPAGTVLDPGHLRSGPRPGDPVAVVLTAGSLVVEQAGRAVPCRPGRACALMPSGRRVEGTWHAGRIEVDSR